MASRLQKLTQALLASAMGVFAASSTTFAAISRVEDAAKVRLNAEQRLPMLLEATASATQERVAPAGIVIPQPLAVGPAYVTSVRPPVAAPPAEGALLDALDDELANIAADIAADIAAQSNATLVAALDAELDVVTESAADTVAQGSLGLALDNELDSLFLESDPVVASPEPTGASLDEILEAELNEVKIAMEQDAIAAKRETVAGASMVDALEAEMTVLGAPQADETEGFDLWAALDAEL